MNRFISKVEPRTTYIKDESLKEIGESYSTDISILVSKVNQFLISLNGLYIGGDAEFSKVELIKYIDSLYNPELIESDNPRGEGLGGIEGNGRV